MILEPCRTPKVVYTISSGVHPKWFTPQGVVHTISGAYHNWSIPRVFTIQVAAAVNSLTSKTSCVEGKPGWVKYAECIYLEANAQISLI